MAAPEYAVCTSRLVQRAHLVARAIETLVFLLHHHILSFLTLPHLPPSLSLSLSLHGRPPDSFFTPYFSSSAGFLPGSTITEPLHSYHTALPAVPGSIINFLGVHAGLVDEHLLP